MGKDHLPRQKLHFSSALILVSIEDELVFLTLIFRCSCNTCTPLVIENDIGQSEYSISNNPIRYQLCDTCHLLL